MSNYYANGGGLPYAGPRGALSDEADDRRLAASVREMTSSPLFILWNIGHFVSVPTLAYHGYKRNNSVGWAIMWGLLGSFVWPVTVPVAFAQGYAKRHVKANRRSKRRRRTSRRTSRRTTR